MKEALKKLFGFIAIFAGFGAMFGFAAAGNPVAGAASIMGAAFLTAYIATR